MAKKNKPDADVSGSSGVKRIKHRAEDDDDDFVIVPYKARSKNPGPLSSDSEVDVVDAGTDQRRVSPKVLVDALKRMNPQQKNAIADLGFGHIFHLKVDSVPGKIVSWCLEIFRPMSCSIELTNKPLIHIAAEDVYLIFGFPKGALRIDQHSRTKDKEIVEEWADRFGKSKYRILPSEVVSAMLTEVDGGDWFRRLFLMLVETCLFENAADGYVKPKIMDILRDLSKIREYDWCDHMITSLLRTHERWVANKNKKFTGPSVFLVLFYVDRVVHFKRHVERAFPLMKGWTSDALRVRQRSEFENVGFGCGHVDSRFDGMTHWDTMVQDKKLEALTFGEGTSNQSSTDEEVYTHNLIVTAKKVAESMSVLMNLIMEAPLKIRQHESFNHVVQSTTALIGIKCLTERIKDESVAECTQKLFDWGGSAEWQEGIVKMMEVFEEKQKLEDRLGDPSFSLGLSQDPNFNREVSTPNDQQDQERIEVKVISSVSNKADFDLARNVDVPILGTKSFKDTVISCSEVRVHEPCDDSKPIVDATMPCISTSEEASKAIDSVVKE